MAVSGREAQYCAIRCARNKATTAAVRPPMETPENRILVIRTYRDRFYIV